MFISLLYNTNIGRSTIFVSQSLIKIINFIFFNFREYEKVDEEYNNEIHSFYYMSNVLLLNYFRLTNLYRYPYQFLLMLFYI